MAIESAVLALGLLGVSRGLDPLLKSLGVPLAAAPAGENAARVITFVGAGIYEEVLFRLLLFGGVMALLGRLGTSGLLAFLLAAGGSALAFAAAHNAGAEPFDGYAFLFRTLAGLYFTLVFQLRGCGVAMGAHACYDVLVGVLLSSHPHA
jgi:membrane protease YdiL (CAAX protease family)